MNSDVIQFHNLAHIFISLIGAVLLLAIYINIRKRFHSLLEENNNQKRVDKGLLFLSLSLFTWVASGIWAYSASLLNWDSGLIFQSGENIFSIINNLFLLLALSYFYYAPSFIYKNSKNIKLILWIIIIVSVLTFVVSISLENKVVSQVKLHTIPDLLLSSFLSYLLLVSFYKTFVYRGLKIVALISIVVISLVWASQLPSTFLVLDNVFINNLVKIIAKTSLISLFLVLATTWVIQLANTPRINEIRIKFIDWSLIQLSIPSKNINNLNIDFGSKTTQFKNLIKLAFRRKYMSGDAQSLIVGASGEIKSQTYLSRIIEDINNISKLSSEQKLERKDLFTFLGEGRYRLRILPEHIDIEKNLKQEFSETKNKDI